MVLNLLATGKQVFLCVYFFNYYLIMFSFVKIKRYKNICRIFKFFTLLKNKEKLPLI